MGLSYSISSNNVAGRSIFHRTYRTRIPIALQYSAYDKRYYLATWDDEPSLGNPLPDEGAMQLPAGIIFTVIDVRYQPGLLEIIDPSLKVNVTLLENVSFAHITKRIRVKNKTTLEVGFLEYENVEADLVFGDKIEELMDTRLNVLLLEGFECELYSWQFFPHKGANKDDPLCADDTLIQEINITSTSSAKQERKKTNFKNAAASMFEDWILQGHNCIAFVLIIFAVVFMFMAFAAWGCVKTVMFCVFATFVCTFFALYFLNPRSIIKQSPVC